MSLFLAATAALFLACALYFRGRFLLAAVLGIAYAALAFETARPRLPSTLFWTSFLLFCVAPGSFLGLHVVDIRRGIFLLPTIYSIPIAFLGAGFFWALVGVALLW